MADNVPVTSGVATYTAATDKVTYSSDANVDVQLVKPVGTTGAEGSKTVVDIIGTAGTPSTGVVSVQGVSSGTPVPVSLATVPSHAVTNAGTFAVQAAQTGTWTLQPGNTQNTTPWKVLFTDAVGTPVSSTVAKTTDTITAALDTATLQNGTTSLTPKWVTLSVASSGHNVAVAAVTSKKIRVVAAVISPSAAVNVKFKTAAAGADIFPLKYCGAAGADLVLPFNPVGWCETVAGDLLSLNLSGAVTVSAQIQYVEV